MSHQAVEPLSEPRNLSFEDGEGEGGAPTYWKVVGEGYSFQLDTETARGGTASARMSSQIEDIDRSGSAGQDFAADNYLDKRLRIRAHLKTDSVEGWSGVWARVEDASGRVLSFQGMSDNPLSATLDWTECDVSVDVPPEASVIHIGFLLIGSGTVWADDFELEVIGDLGVGLEPPRALTKRGLENLVAFARLLGYLRYFHPSDAASSVDWEKFALDGVEAVENASDSEELILELQRFSSPVAPAVRIFPSGKLPELPPELTSPGSDAEVIAWRHLGVGISARHHIYSSARTTGNDPSPGEAFMLSRKLAASHLRGKKVRFQASIRAAMKGSCSAELAMGFGAEDGKAVAGEKTTTRPISASAAWEPYELSAQVPDGAEWVGLGITIKGWGDIWMRSARLEAATDAALGWPPDVTELDSLTGWDHDPPSWERGGYRTDEVTDPESDTRVFHISRDPIEWPPVAPNEPLVREIADGVSCLVPIALYVSEDGSSAEKEDRAVALSRRPEGFVPSGNDRTTRLADVILAWNVLQHFYPYFDVVRADWLGELPKALEKAAEDPSDLEFLKTLRLMVAALKDGHGNVVGRPIKSLRLPVLWDWVEGRLVITAVVEGVTQLRRGDFVTKIDGINVEEVMEEESTYISAATRQLRLSRTLFYMRCFERARPVELHIERPGSESFVVSLTPEPNSIDQSLMGSLPEKVDELRPGIFYVDISRIDDSEFTQALPRLADADGIVFDLRGYPSGSVLPISHMITEPVTSPRWNIPIVTLPDRQGMAFHSEYWLVEPRTPTLPSNRAFLTDGRAISYAETYLGIIEHYRLAEIVGEASAGTNGNVNPFSLPGGYRVFWTGMKVLKQDGSQLHGVGILPTVPASKTIQGISEGRDEVLETAVALLVERSKC